jgi:hypothetical protein
MPAPIDPAIKSQIERAYVAGVSIADLAKKFKVSVRAIEGWSAKEHWEAKRKANNVIDIAQRPKPEPKLERPPTARESKGASEAVEIADRVIFGLEAELANSHGKDYAAVANCLKGWVEYRDRIRPVTLEQLIDRVVITLSEWKLSPVDFVKGLRDRRLG